MKCPFHQGKSTSCKYDSSLLMWTLTSWLRICLPGSSVFKKKKIVILNTEEVLCEFTDLKWPFRGEVKFEIPEVLVFVSLPLLFFLFLG